MITIHPYLILSGDSINTIKEKFNLSTETIKLYNPLIRNNQLTIGNILYIPIETKEQRNISKDEIDPFISSINYYSKEDYISYYLKRNDHSLVEQKLFEEYLLFSSKLTNDNNSALIIQSHLITMHQEMHNLIDYLSQKNENNISSSQNKIKEIIEAMSDYLASNQIYFDKKTIYKNVELNIKMIVYILEENYHDLRLIAF